MTAIQTDSAPTPEKETRSSSHFDRSLAIVSFVILLANSGCAIFLFQIYGRYELMHKRAELETQTRPHIKHDFETKVTVVSAPNGTAPGVFCVSFTGKITNNGKFPFTLGRDSMTLALGTYDPKQIDSTTPIVVNDPGIAGPISWAKPRDLEVVGRVEPSTVFPGEENLVESSFLVSGPSYAFLHVRYSVPRIVDGDNIGPWNHSHVVHLLDIAKADDKAGKTK